MSHQLPDEIKLELLKVKQAQAHQVAMYWERTKRTWVYLCAAVTLIGFLLTAAVSLWLGRPVELTPQAIPLPKPRLLTDAYFSQYENARCCAPGIHDYLININNQG